MPSLQKQLQNVQSALNHVVFQNKLKNHMKSIEIPRKSMEINRKPFEIQRHPLEIYSQRAFQQGLWMGSSNSRSFREGFMKLLAADWTRDRDCQKKSKEICSMELASLRVLSKQPSRRSFGAAFLLQNAMDFASRDPSVFDKCLIP